MLKIKKLYIENINNLEGIEIPLNDGFNIICGQNGVGKTTVLNCILASFNRKKIGLLKVNASENHGFWEIEYFRNYASESRVHYIHKEDEIYDSRSIKGDKLINSNYIISFSVNNRNMSTQYYGGNPLKQWLYKNYYLSDLNYSKENNFSLVKECFSMIDPSVSFYKIEEVMDERKLNRSVYRTPNNHNVELYVANSKGIIKIDQMSAGYQSVLMILLSLVKKIESLDQFGVSVHNFEGVLLIDEIDLYLHPEWQKKLVQIIRWLLPNAQIITTTHSPHIIQSARSKEIIPLGIDFFERVYIRDLPDSSEFGYQGWTIEEILTDVMGLQETRSEEYKNTIREFDRAMDNEDARAAERSYKRLESMLHPNNSSLKLLKLQMASLGGFSNDKNK
ncbi:AAA family ATPase [Brevibacillus centrosporus]|uniref:AAA domain-containing protein, putative AbiEii toxin, Type IV TA system n=1 Tax=Brevibacillus centrosporus TaxID=54910 RepID=A0A1I3L4X8_9BACL|nr:AAA family ATPase [Brevibacillus centrosporus]SFI79731.1 AAA domain-containing protein, putative AbiEii toxin, Type IV TA system [Brevibacillus centrosporus]